MRDPCGGDQVRGRWLATLAVLAGGAVLAGCGKVPTFEEARGLPFKPTAHMLVASGDNQPGLGALFLACDAGRRPHAVAVYSLPLHPRSKTIGLMDDVVIQVRVSDRARDLPVTLGRLPLILVGAGRRETLLSPPLTGAQFQALETAVLTPGRRTTFSLTGFAEAGVRLKADPEGYVVRRAAFDCDAP